jgi:hypothetical protein
LQVDYLALLEHLVAREGELPLPGVNVTQLLLYQLSVLHDELLVLGDLPLGLADVLIDSDQVHELPPPLVA